MTTAGPNVYNINQEIILSLKFKSGGILTEPSTISLIIELPDASTISKTKPDLTKVADGDYTYAYTPTVQGTFSYYVSSTGLVKAAAENYFVVRKKQTG